ncbi:hypothetical protein M378DRAFT_169177 [Amanita muscaria Koide BX008]|uniref:Uncharacterized protein n=1 Tax=Amanita muscaria (strain Koide BX008) TaxID=946122 RepID=A0A0C2WDW3_AMAMK|nr:hypothetical protein M378DRAFT_169177 [Amanita muscaria Koide BX008]
MLPQAILDEFLDVPAGTTDENEWYGAWNVLLTEYFPVREGWIVKPQVERESVDYGVLFKIERQRIPVMFVEIKPLTAMNSLSVRADADAQMRQRFLDFFDAMPTILTGISAFGHVVCKYELDKENKRITPSKIERRTNCVTDVAPRARWDLDLTTAEGAARIQAIFQEVKNVKLNEVGFAMLLQA